MIRVASVPHGHVYVRHLSDPYGDSELVRLPDAPSPGAASGAPWWPPAMLEPAWIAAHAAEFDLYHIHFGFDAVSSDDLRTLVQTLRRHRKPLIYTVHDLRNPHHAEREAHDAALDVLVTAADAVVTLTDGAAREIMHRWSRSAHVVPHPHVVELDRIAASREWRARRRVARPIVGLHLKSLRANMNALPVLSALVAEVREHGADLRVDVHNDVVTRGSAAYDARVAEALHQAASQSHVTVHQHDFFSDEQLWSYLEGLDLSVLPYRFGTHSGWLEACYDLGTRVLAPQVGYYADQRPGVYTYGLDEGDVPDASAIRSALKALHAGAEPWQAEAGARLRQRREIAQVHRRIYEAAIGADLT